MKKLFLIVAALCTFAACNKPLGPEYQTPPELGAPMYESTNVQAGESVTVSLPVYSLYGVRAIETYYMINDNQSTVKNILEFIDDAREVDMLYQVDIPGQPAGTKVTFEIVVITPYSVWNVSESGSYTVTGGVPVPIDEP